jgi:hypothetical protein
MDHLNPSTSTETSRKFPVKTLLVAVVIIAAAAAILVFKVPVTTVLSYGFFGLMMSSHFFMHGGHGSHTGKDQGSSTDKQGDEHVHPNSNDSQISELSPVDQLTQLENPEAKSDKEKNSHQGHSGCC